MDGCLIFNSIFTAHLSHTHISRSFVLPATSQTSGTADRRRLSAPHQGFPASALLFLPVSAGFCRFLMPLTL